MTERDKKSDPERDRAGHLGAAREGGASREGIVMKTTTALLVAGALLVGVGFGRAEEKPAPKEAAPAAQPAAKAPCNPQDVATTGRP